jgi:hypothetical protein
MPAITSAMKNIDRHNLAIEIKYRRRWNIEIGRIVRGYATDHESCLRAGSGNAKGASWLRGPPGAIRR